MNSVVSAIIVIGVLFLQLTTTRAWQRTNIISHTKLLSPLCLQSMRLTFLKELLGEKDVVSPFTNENIENNTSDGKKEPLELTIENVELVLDSMRPFLRADGGDVLVSEIVGTVVKLELQGNCGTCSASAATMKFGLERALKERIPQITEVRQETGKFSEISREVIEEVLDSVRPFLSVAGSQIHIVQYVDGGSLSKPRVKLRLMGTSASLRSVRQEIENRIQNKCNSSIVIEWDI